MIELRFFRDRYNTDSDYYLSNRDVYCRLYFKNIDELKSQWKALFRAEKHFLEGETYSAWQGKNVLCGGAFDPGDIEYIEEAYVGRKSK